MVLRLLGRPYMDRQLIDKIVRITYFIHILGIVLIIWIDWIRSFIIFSCFIYASLKNV